MLFADLVDSTVLGSRNDPEVVRGIMARYFARLSEIAELHGGTVEKFIGDAVMVVFGVPQVHEDDAERAVRAALVMRDAVADLEEELGVGLAVRIAVNTGEVVAGAGDERQLLVTGEVVNVAARLQQGADAGDVVVGALTQRLTREAIEYEPLEPMVAKGISEPIPAFRALHARTTLPEQHRGTPMLRASLVGRERELDILMDAFARAAADRTGYLVTVLGNAGVGKSRLVGEVLARLGARDGIRVLRGRCPPYGSGITHWPLMDVVRQDAQIEASDDAGSAREKVGRRVAELLPADARQAVVARISLLLGLEDAGGALPGVAPERIGVELSWGFRQYIEAVAAQDPVVVLIDDLQWAEPAAVEIIGELVDPPPEVPLLLVCMARPDLMERHPGWAAARPNASIIALEPLDERGTRTLLSRLLGMEDLPPLIASQVADRSAGNPLFCEEFLRMLIEDGMLELVEGEWRAGPSAAQLDLPETVHAIVAARIDNLGNDEKRVLQTASVMGERFGADELLELSAVTGAAPESLIRKGFLERDREDPSRRALRIKHMVIRDVAYDSLPKLERASLHDRIGHKLEEAMPERLDEFSEVLAYHAVRAFRLSQELRLGSVLPEREAWALRWSGAAGDRALALYATRQAAAHYVTAIELASREGANSETLRDLYGRCGRALELHGEYEGAIRAYEALEALGVERGDDRLRADAIIHQGTLYTTPTRICDPVRADALLEQALEIGRSLGDQMLLAQVQRDQIHIELYRGGVEEAIRKGEASLEAAQRVGSEEQRAYTLNGLSCAYREAGRLDAGRAVLAQAKDVFQARDNKPMVANVLSQLAGLEFVDGKYDSALRACAEARRLTEESGNLWGQAFSRISALWVHAERGELGEAIAAGEEGLRLAQMGGLGTFQAFSRADLGYCYRLAGADDLGDEHQRAADAFSAERLPHWRGWTLAHLARAAVTRGDLAEAADLLKVAGEILSARPELFAFAHAHLGLATIELLLATDRRANAVEEARAGGDRQRELMRPYVADFEYLEGEALRLLGRHEESRDALERAARSASALGCRRLMWQILASQASVDEVRGDAIAAERARADARHIVEVISESLVPVGLDERFRQRPEVAALLGGPGSTSAEDRKVESWHSR